MTPLSSPGCACLPHPQALPVQAHCLPGPPLQRWLEFPSGKCGDRSEAPFLLPACLPRGVRRRQLRRRALPRGRFWEWKPRQRGCRARRGDRARYGAPARTGAQCRRGVGPRAPQSRAPRVRATGPSLGAGLGPQQVLSAVSWMGEEGTVLESLSRWVHVVPRRDARGRPGRE